MEKPIITVSYWLGLLSALIALGMRALSVLGILLPSAVPSGRAITYMSFYKGALLFLLIAIATAGYASARGEKT